MSRPPPPGRGLSPRDLFATPIREAPVAVLDLEMTGLSPAGDRVCEIAVVAGAGRVVREFQTLVRPGVPMSRGALACTGITDAMLIGAPVFAEIAGDVVDTVRECVLVGHNVDFDLGFLHREFDGTPVVLPPPVTLDTLLMARRLFAFRSNGLRDVCRALDVRTSSAHRALSDARATFDLFRRMVEILDPDGRVTVRELSDLVGALAPNSPLRLQQQQILRDAHRERRPVWIEYQSSSDPVAGRIRRSIEIWFLRLPKIHAWCRLRNAERVFRLDRIRAVERGEGTYVVPPEAESRV